MKSAFVVLALVAMCGASSATAQFRSQVERESRVWDSGPGTSSASSFLFGWFDPSRFQMRHMISMSYMTAGGQGLSLGTYTNSMLYRFADNLNARADISMSYSPFNTLSKFGGMKDFSGIYLSRAEVNYRPFENMSVHLQYMRMPYGGWYYSPFANPFDRDFGF